MIFFIILLLSLSTQAQFNKTDLDSLKANLLNYADSNCTDEQHLRSATNIIKRLSSPISSTITPDQAKTNDYLRNALSGIRDGLVVGALGNKLSCSQKVKAGIQKLDTLPIKSQPEEVPQKIPDVKARQ
ncbi:MAG: hypothetical protein H6623_08450 [Bdellovibrionaceae bacterium]|nr:hypothetical protein [Pseudobdellovibrionaceae bacterium]